MTDEIPSRCDKCGSNWIMREYDDFYCVKCGKRFYTERFSSLRLVGVGRDRKVEARHIAGLKAWQTRQNRRIK